MSLLQRFGNAFGAAQKGLRVVNPGADYDTTAIDEVVFDSRFPVVTSVQSGAINLGGRGSSSVTVTFPQRAIVPLVLSAVSAEQFDVKGRVTGYNSSVQPQYAPDSIERVGGAWTPNPDNISENTSGTAPSDARAKVTFPTLYWDELGNPRGSEPRRRGYVMEIYRNRFVARNFYENSVVLTYHVLNIGPPAT